MIRVVIKGGLGNQIFQYVYGKVLAKKYSQPLVLDISFYDKENVYRDFQLPEIGVQDATETRKPKKWQISLWRRLLPVNLWLVEKGLRPIGPLYLVGYWQSERYFGNDFDYVRSLFALPEPPKEIATKVKSSNSVAVHVRRGDYVGNPAREICRLEYYLECMRKAKQQIDDASFYIFSEDLEWCEAILSEFPDATLVRDCKTDAQELHLMMMCKHIIISNSSFSWWGAWMKEYPGKLVFSPDRWAGDEELNRRSMTERGIVPERWIKNSVSIPDNE